MPSPSFVICDSFYVNGRTVLTVNQEIPIEMLQNSHVTIGGHSSIPYLPVHNDYMISIDGNHDYTGQTLTFVS